MKRLDGEFYQRGDVVTIARELLGKVLVSVENGVQTTGIICETEAYAGVVDKASHAYGGRRTPRTEIMYLTGGHSYVYLCYGIHYLFNVVTNVRDTPHAVLVRGVLALSGSEIIELRRNKKVDKKSGIGPGNVTKCLGIHMAHNGLNMLESQEVWIEDHGILVPKKELINTARIGVDYAGEDAKLPYRFVWDRK